MGRQQLTEAIVTPAMISSVHLLRLLLLLLLAPVTLTFEFDTGISFQARYEAYKAQHAPPPNSLPVTRRPRSPLVTLPGTSESEYHVVVGYGTPAQNLTVGFDAGAGGATLLHCKPGAFDPSRSSSVAYVPCGSPDCPLEACSGRGCASTTVAKNGAVISSVTVVTDTLTFSPSTPTTVDNFRANCMEMGGRTADRSSGLLDVGRDSHSLPSRAPSSPDTAAFSYCLPTFRADRGFLSIGAPLPGPGRKVSYTPLRSNAALPNSYFVRLAGLSLGTGRPVIPVPAGDALMALRTTFTYLMPETYAALRDQFKEQMAQYPVAPPMGFLETCYNFTGLRKIDVPPVTLTFDSGASLELGIRQMMYFEDRDYVFSAGCLAFAAPAWAVYPAGVAAVIGTLAQETTEVVYDVHADMVGFVPDRCEQ
nr:aspartyl protease family protein At5g10770-like [Aegilops tauschii subsp. strangulata]